MTQTFLFPDPSRRLTRPEALAEFEKLKARVARMKFATDEKPQPRKAKP